MVDYFLETGMIRPYYSVISLALLFIISGTISALMAIFCSISHRQSILLEEILYNLRNKENSSNTNDFKKNGQES